MRAEVLHGPRRSPCSFAGPQPGLERTDERRVPQRGSETKREFFSDLAHLSPDLAVNVSCVECTYYNSVKVGLEDSGCCPSCREREPC